MLDNDSGSFWNLPSPGKYYHLVETVSESTKGHSTILQTCLFQKNGEFSKTSEFHDHGPIAALHLLWSEFFDQNSLTYYDAG